MRGALAAAALAAALAALAAPACQPSSLAPGWIDERGPDGGAAAGIVSGRWEGPTSRGGVMRFQVVDGNLIDVHLGGDGPCGFVFFSGDRILTENRTFAVTYWIQSGGFFSIEGTFSAPDACRGSYSYSGVAASLDCPREAAGTFSLVPVL